MKVIINADDFGFTEGVTLGIIKSIEEGVVSSTTAMANGLYFHQAMKLAMEKNIKCIGVHLTLTFGRPILPPSEVPSLVDQNGNFAVNKDNIKKINLDEVKKRIKSTNKFI